MKRVYITTALTCLVMLAAFIGCFRVLNLTGGRDSLKVGFIYDNDESTPYTYNFSLARDAVAKKYGEKVEILTCSNVLDEEMEEPLRELADDGCDIIFFNGYSEKVRQLAPEYPDIQFCQTSYMDMYGQNVPANYHTFKGEAYQGRYVSGIAAGLKIKHHFRGPGCCWFCCGISDVRGHFGLHSLPVGNPFCGTAGCYAGVLYGNMEQLRTGKGCSAEAAG